MMAATKDKSGVRIVWHRWRDFYSVYTMEVR